MTIPTEHKRAFRGCVRHDTFNYYCHPCLVETIGNLCKILDEKEKPRGIQARVGFTDSSDRWHVHIEEQTLDKENRAMFIKTIDTSMCPTCEVNDATDGTSEGGDRPTGQR